MNLFDLARYVKSLFGLLTGRSRLTSKSDTACVVVGMEKSSKYGACPGSRNDSDRMAKLLKDYGSVRLMQDGQATKAMFLDALREAVSKDLCILYYSGHGGKEGDNEYLCFNNGPFWDHEIWDVISKSKGRVFCIFDCCHSGHMYRDAIPDLGEAVKTALSRTPVGFMFSMLRSVARSASGNNVLVWSGCPKDSYSYGDPSGGVFTNGLLKGVSRVATYDTVWESARKAASSQNPVRTVLGTGFDGLVFR